MFITVYECSRIYNKWVLHNFFFWYKVFNGKFTKWQVVIQKFSALPFLLHTIISSKSYLRPWSHVILKIVCMFLYDIQRRHWRYWKISTNFSKFRKLWTNIDKAWKRLKNVIKHQQTLRNIEKHYQISK